MIWLFSPYLPPGSGEEVKKTIDSGFINRGKKAKEFEELFKELFNCYQVLGVNSCTSALKLSLKVAGVKEGDQVISTPWTMIASNTSILECGAKPIFVDIDYDTFNLDPNKIEENISSKTKAIMVVHYAGYPAEIDQIFKIAYKHNLEVIQDCAHALGARYKGKYIGSFGRFCCFSFQAIKAITMGDGGLISTIDQRVYEELVKRSWFGIDKSKRIKTLVGSFPEDIDTLGYKNNLTDIDATLGLHGLKNFSYANNRRQKIAKRYNEAFGKLRRIKLPNYKEGYESSYWLYPIHVEKRDSFAKFMKESQIQVDKHNERNDKYKIFGGIQEDLVNAKKVDEDIIHIPIHPNLTEEEVETVITKIKEWDRSE